MAPGDECKQWWYLSLTVESWISWKTPKFGSPGPSLGMIFLCFRHPTGSQSQSGYGLLEFVWASCSEDWSSLLPWAQSGQHAQPHLSQQLLKWWGWYLIIFFSCFPAQFCSQYFGCVCFPQGLQQRSHSRPGLHLLRGDAGTKPSNRHVTCTCHRTTFFITMPHLHHEKRFFFCFQFSSAWPSISFSGQAGQRRQR